MQKDNRLWCYQNLILLSLCLHSSLNTLQSTILILFLPDLRNRMGRRSFTSLHLGIPTEVSQNKEHPYVSWKRNIIIDHHFHRQQLESTPLPAAWLCYWTEPGTPGSWRYLPRYSWREETSLTHCCSLSFLIINSSGRHPPISIVMLVIWGNVQFPEQNKRISFC